MTTKEERLRLQEKFDELALKYDTDEAQKRLARERRQRLQPLTFEHQQFLARSWQAASGRVVR